MIKQTQLGLFKKQLLDRQQELTELLQTGDEAADVVELDQTRVGRLSRMDALQGQAMSQERTRRRKQELQRIASALMRIENDDFGLCVKCGEDIMLKRLEFDPSTPTCIDCANALDDINVK